MPGPLPLNPGQQTSRPPTLFPSLDSFGHSFTQAFNTGTAYGSGTTALNANSLFEYIFGSSIGVPPQNFRNHGVVGAQFCAPGRASGGFARVLNEIGRHGHVTYPFFRLGGPVQFCWGANDTGNTAAGSQALLQSTMKNAMRACIAKARASSIYLANAGAPWALGANFSAAPASAADFTSGNATNATVVDSAGTTTATFTIPIGYQGEPICFNMVALSGGSLIVTWGGTVTGTTSIVGRTDTLSAASTTATCAYGVRFTAPVNGLSAANAGQTISVRVTTISGSTFTLDGAWIEAWKPNPVLVCNHPRLPERLVTYQFGDGSCTGTTTLNSNSAQFLASTDSGFSNAVIELDAQAAIKVGSTVSSVTGATAIVLSQTTNGTFSNIKFSIQRALNGYSNGLYGFSNTNFTGATPSNHAAADNDVLNWNAALAAVIAEFDGMVQIIDLDTALGEGSPSTIPANVLQWVALDANHPNDLGAQRCALYSYKAAAALRSGPDLQANTPLDLATSIVDYPVSPMRLAVASSSIVTPIYAGYGTNYTCVTGDVFAYPVWVTETTWIWGASMIEQISSSGAASVRIGWYDDIGNNAYPQCLVSEPTSGGAFSLGTTAGVKGPGSFSKPVKPGWNWLVLKIDAGGTTALLRSILGPNPLLPGWLAAGGAVAPSAYKLTGVGAGALPTIFASGATLVGSATSTPAIGVTTTVQ